MSLADALTAVGLLLGFALLSRVRTPRGPSTPVSVSVVVPARNEEASLPHLLRSLADQTLPAAQVIVVDDASTDATAAIATSAGAVLVRAPAIPDGWIGKPWACHNGSLQATGDVVVFLDADVVLAPDGLDRIVGSWQRDAPDGLLSVQPFHTTVRAYEQCSAYPNLMSVMASGAFAPRWLPTEPVAFGPCLVTSVSAYRAVGGHESVAAEVIEDVLLARTYDRAGLPVQVLAGGSALSFRMYPSGFRQLVDGWTKNLAGGPRLVGVLPLLAAVAWLMASIVVASDFVGALAAGAVTGHLRWMPVVAWALVAAQTSLFLRRVGAFRWWAAPAFPVLLAAFVAIFARSVFHRAFLRSVTWNDRSIAVRPK